jgi:hypothetical protein
MSTRVAWATLESADTEHVISVMLVPNRPTLVTAALTAMTGGTVSRRRGLGHVRRTVGPHRRRPDRPGRDAPAEAVSRRPPGVGSGSESAHQAEVGSEGALLTNVRPGAKKLI